MPRKRSTKTATRRTARNSEKEVLWRSYITEQASSGLSAKQFCQSKGLNVNNFHWWRHEIARRDLETRSPTPAANPFVPVRIITLPQSEPGLEVLLPGDAVIKVTNSSPLDLLAKVLRMLEVQC